MGFDQPTLDTNVPVHIQRKQSGILTPPMTPTSASEAGDEPMDIVNDVAPLPPPLPLGSMDLFLAQQASSLRQASSIQPCTAPYISLDDVTMGDAIAAEQSAMISHAPPVPAKRRLQDEPSHLDEDIGLRDFEVRGTLGMSHCLCSGSVD